MNVGIESFESYTKNLPQLHESEVKAFVSITMITQFDFSETDLVAF